VIKIPPLSGMALMVIAVFSFTVMEILVKLVSTRVDTLLVLWFRNAGQLLLTLLIVAPRLRQVMRAKYPKLQIMRAVFMLSATASFFIGFQKNSLVESNAIAQMAPIFLTLGAVIFLGERIGKHRTISVGVGLIGAMIILRPGTGNFSAWLLFPMLGALLYSGYALATRFVGRDEDVWTSLLWTGFIATALISLFLPLIWTTPSGTDLLILLGIGLLGSLAQFFLTTAFVRAEASALAPLTYISLIFSAVWGILVFDHYPDAPVYLGALVIVLAGLYVWHRETRGKA
jgi:drug/metabolite transporter (DMT)-like permease